MRNWKNWLFPLLTCLITAGLALLPLRLSMRGDEGQAGVVHSEPLDGNSNFPAKAPELPGRIWLLAQRNSIPDGLTIMDQVLEGAALEEASVQAGNALELLEKAGVLPEGSGRQFGSFSGNRLYLRDQTDLSSAAFWELSAYDEKTGAFIWMSLDREFGQILELELAMDLFLKFPGCAADIGRAFLNSLGVSYTEVEELKNTQLMSVFLLPDSQALYSIHREIGFLSIRLDVDWEIMDNLLKSQQAAAAGIVYDSGGGNDAGMMQKGGNFDGERQ